MFTHHSPLSLTRTQTFHLLKGGIFIFPLLPTWGAICLVIVLFNIWIQNYRQILKHPLYQGFAILSLWLIFSSCFGYQPQDSFLGLGNFLPLFFLFATVSCLIQTPTHLRQLSWILIVPSLPVVILGLGQVLGGWSWELSPILGWELVTQGNPENRMASVFMYANILAAYLTLVFIFTLGLWIETYQKWRGKLTDQKGWKLLFLTVILLANIAGLILTSSRNAWAIAFIGVLIFTVYLGWRWIVLGFLSAVTTILWASFGVSPSRDWLRRIVPRYFWARLSDELYSDRPVDTLRITQWRFTGKMIQEHPILGWGLRSFSPYYEASTGIWLGHPHNFFLMFTAETGLPGMVLLGGLVGWILFQGIRVLQQELTTTGGNITADKLLFFTYFTAFGCCILFNFLDVTIFDFRVNTLGWIVLSAIYGVVKRETIKKPV